MTEPEAGDRQLRGPSTTASRLALYANLTVLLLAGVIVVLSPADTRAEMLLRLISIIAAWPVVAGAVLVAFFVSFRNELSTYLKVARVKYGGLELSADQAQTPTAAIGAIAIAAEKPATEPERKAPPSAELSDFKVWLTNELKKTEREARSWKNVFLDRFLVDSCLSACFSRAQPVAVDEIGTLLG